MFGAECRSATAPKVRGVSGTSTWSTSPTPTTGSPTIRPCAGSCRSGSSTSPSTACWPPATRRRGPLLVDRRDHSGRLGLVASSHPERRKEFLAAVATGQLEISALPRTTRRSSTGRVAYHAPLAARGIWQKVRPRVAIQNDVNGTPGPGRSPCWTGACAISSPGSMRTRRGAHAAALGLLGENARRPPHARLSQLLLTRRLLVLRAGGVAAWAGARAEIRAIGRPAPAISSPPTRHRSARHTRTPFADRRAGGRGLPLPDACPLDHQPVADRQRPAAFAAGRFRGGLEPPRPEANRAPDDRQHRHGTTRARGRQGSPGAFGRVDRLVGQRHGFGAPRGGRKPRGQTADRCGGIARLGRSGCQRLPHDRGPA